MLCVCVCVCVCVAGGGGYDLRNSFCHSRFIISKETMKIIGFVVEQGKF